MSPCLGVGATLPVPPVDAPCAALALEAGAELAHTWPTAGLGTTVSLPRTRVDLGWQGGPVRARLGVGVVRSGGEAGYLGIDGEAIVPWVRVAEGGLGWRGFTVAGGVVETGWSALADAAWGLPAFAPSLGARTGWVDGSDLGGAVTWAAPGAWLRARVELTAGEGVSGREVNDGKDLGAVLELRPFADGPAAGFAVAAYARDGSRGLGSVRDDRLGGMVSYRAARAAVGVEGLAAWGVDGDATRTPVGLGVWARARPIGPLLVVARTDGWSEDLSRSAAGQFMARAGAGVELESGAIGATRLLVGVQHRRAGDAVVPLAGADGLAADTSIFVNLSTDLLLTPGAP